VPSIVIDAELLAPETNVRPLVVDNLIVPAEAYTASSQQNFPQAAEW
jgi:hypothetical protein